LDSIRKTICVISFQLRHINSEEPMQWQSNAEIFSFPIDVDYVRVKTKKSTEIRDMKAKLYRAQKIDF
jgi:hypothetical protein